MVRKKEIINNKKEENNLNSKGKSVLVMNRKEAHKQWGNQYKNNCDKMEKCMGIMFQGRIYYTGCGLVKSIEKRVEKVSKINSTKSGERICLDATCPYLTNPGGTRYFMCDLYDFTDISWLYFMKRKSEMVKFVSNLLGFF